jgi:hypothetical protein
MTQSPDDMAPRAAGACDDDDALPTVRLSAPDSTADLLLRLQAMVLKHPAASQAVFRALVAEGRAFARTPEGKEWKRRLESSVLLHRARLILDLPGISMLESDSEDAIPSSYIDTIFMLAASDDPGDVLNHLFRWEYDHDGT